MPKKYLVYIHDHEKFDELSGRGEKSGLINRLLEAHWNARSVRSASQKGREHGKSRALKMAQTAAERLRTDLCGHGAAAGFCKRKGCPNAPRSLGA